MPFVNGIWQDEIPVDDNQESPSDPNQPEVEIPIPEYKPITNSIMLTVKKMLGIAEEYHAFDLDIITNINAVFLTLNQLGVGPEYPFAITGPETQWDDFLGDQFEILQAIQTYTFMRVRLMFDPPTNSFLVDSMQKQIDEMEWRFMTQVDYHKNQNGSDETTKPDEDPFVEMSAERVREIYEEAKAGNPYAIATLESIMPAISKLKNKPMTIKDIFR